MNYPKVQNFTAKYSLSTNPTHTHSKAATLSTSNSGGISTTSSVTSCTVTHYPSSLGTNITGLSYLMFFF